MPNVVTVVEVEEYTWSIVFAGHGRGLAPVTHVVHKEPHRDRPADEGRDEVEESADTQMFVVHILHKDVVHKVEEEIGDKWHQ